MRQPGLCKTRLGLCTIFALLSVWRLLLDMAVPDNQQIYYVLLRKAIWLITMSVAPGLSQLGETGEEGKQTMHQPCQQTLNVSM